MSDLKLIIGNKNYSSWSLRPWIFMKYFNLSFEEKRVPLYTATTDSELAEYNSNFKVPVLVDGDINVWDSLSILEYLSERFLNSEGLPNDPKQRAIARSMSAEMHSSYFNIRNDLPMNCRKSILGVEISQQTQDEINRVLSLWQQCRTDFGVGGDYLFGKFSIVDAMFAPIVSRFETYHITQNDICSAYSKKILHLPAMVEWITASHQETEVITSEER